VIGKSPAVILGAVVLAFCVLVAICLLPLLYIGWFDLRFPGLERLFPRPHVTVIFRSLSIIVGAGQPISVGLNSLARAYPRPWIRRRMARVARAVDQGEPWSAALHSQGLVRDAELAVIDAAERAGNLAWALRELADAGERRSSYRLELLAQLLFPAALLMAAVMLLSIAVAYFGPLALLIERLA
jgi:type II secretory pathway component PulF